MRTTAAVRAKRSSPVARTSSSRKPRTFPVIGARTPKCVPRHRGVRARTDRTALASKSRSPQRSPPANTILYNGSRLEASGQGDPGDAPQRSMPELSSESRRLAPRVVQDRRAVALQRAGIAGLSLMRAGRRISARQDRACATGSSPRQTVCGQGSRVGSGPGPFRGGNAARLYLCCWSGTSVRQLLDATRSPAGGRQRASKTTGAMT